MKILHTADWHLGQKFKQHQDRIEEHRHVMSWLLDIIRKEKIDVLIVAGDIFDTPNPPNNARELYYKFLVDVAKTSCRHTIITGGNHDSPSMLNAPKEVLSVIKTHVVGCVTGDIKDEIIPLHDEQGELEAVVAAVPFLRDRDLNTAKSGEGGEDRIAKIKEGIKQHYQAAADEIQSYKDRNVPLITTGHLYAKGASASDSRQNNIYVGNMDNITADQFPNIFDYVALGHIHKAQVIGKKQHIRYSGSLIPMSFSEWEDNKSVTIVEFEDRNIKEIRLLDVPVFRKLVAIKGKEKDVEKKLQRIIKELKKQPHALEAWVEIWLSDVETRPDIHHYFTEMANDAPLHIIRVSYKRSQSAIDTLSTHYELDELEPIDIFQKKCESIGMEKEAQKKSLETFKELLNWMEEKEE